MADELKVNITAVLQNGELERTFAPGLQQITQNTQGANWDTLTIGTSEEDITLTDIATEGWCYLRNIDSTNFVTYGPKSGTMVAFGRIKAGEAHAFRLEPGITFTAAADTAAVKLDVMVLED